MEYYIDFLDIENTLITILGYELSYIEFIGIVTGLVSVYYATRANILTWPSGILNEFALFFLFFQVRLYSDMFLQVFFFVITVLGWVTWRRKKKEQPVSWLSSRWRRYYLLSLVLGTLVLGWFVAQIHLLLPALFAHAADYPFADAFTTVASVMATFLLIRKKIETWVCWILVDLVSIYLYFLKGIWFLSLEYCIFLSLAIFGLSSWLKMYKHATRISFR